jgi:excisionase family DNA binding protein
VVGTERLSCSLSVGVRDEESTMSESESTTAAAPLVLTVEEAARLLGISRAHAYELVARAELAHIRLGRRVVVPRRAIDQLIENA